MRLRYLALALMASAFVLSAPTPAAAAGEQVTNMSVTAGLARADVLDVHEAIDYNLAGAPEHVLWRNIPLNLTDDQGRQFMVTFHLIDATRNGQRISPQSTLTTAVSRLALALSGTENHFQLHYTLSPVVMRGVTKDVFRVTFTDLNFPVPLVHASLKLTTPGLTLGDPSCSTGSSGTSSAHCEITQSPNMLTVKTDATLAPAEALTLAGTFPRHSFTAYLGTHASLLSWLAFALLAAAPIGAIALVVVFALRRARRPTE